MTTTDLKPLRPPLPPGRADRKALAYTSEIQRLRALGYTFEAIRLALADVGVHASLTTVKREAARGAARSHRPDWLSMATPAAEHRHPQRPTAPTEIGALPATVGPRTGKQIADEFMQSHISNPLLRAQLSSPASEDDAR